MENKNLIEAILTEYSNAYEADGYSKNEHEYSGYSYLDDDGQEWLIDTQLNGYR